MQNFGSKKNLFFNKLDKIIKEQDYTTFQSFLKGSSFKDFVSENKIDLSINDNFYIKKIISGKHFGFLRFFWFDEKVNDKLKQENPEIYDSCYLYYEIDNAITNNDINKIKELLKNSFENTIIFEDYFLNSHLLKSVNENKKEIFEILLEDGRFDINHSDSYAIRQAVFNDNKDIFLLILKHENFKFNPLSSYMLISCLADYNNVDFFEHLIKNESFKENIQLYEKSLICYNEMRKKLMIKKSIDF